MGTSIENSDTGAEADPATPADLLPDPGPPRPVAPAPTLQSRVTAALLGLRRYGYLIGATLALLAAAFLLWQTWLVFSERSETARVDEVRDWEVRTLGNLITVDRTRVQSAVADEAVTTALAQGDVGRPAAAEALKRVLPDLVSVDFYRPDIADVISANFPQFGYAKASVIVQAHRLQHMGPMQSATGVGKQRNLVVALPVLRDNQLVALAYVALPFAPVIAAFGQRELTAARAELRQGDGNGDLVLASIGNMSAGSTLNTQGVPIADSTLRIGTAPPLQPIFVPRELGLLIPLLLLALLIGALTFYARDQGLRAMFDRLSGRDPVSALAQSTLQRKKTEPVAAALVGADKAAQAAGPAVAVNRSMFRAYDIRGVVGKTLNATVAREIGRAIGSEAIGRGLAEIAVGRDGRLSGPELSDALIDGLRSSGVNVVDIGAAPTPVLYFATYHREIGSGVMVTGSHNPPDYNGFKIVLGGETLSEDAIQKLYKRIVHRDFTSGAGGLRMLDLA
ncbi:MAG TPA: hypothetical protein VIE67_12065, partial [Rudaea sp.]